MQNKINYFTKTTHPIYQQNKHSYKSKKKDFSVKYMNGFRRSLTKEPKLLIKQNHS